jgi:hypothetical protein
VEEKVTSLNKGGFMKKLLVLLLMFCLMTVGFAQEKGKSEPAIPAKPPVEKGEKATPAIPSPNAEHGMMKKAENMEKRDAKKAVKAEKKAAKKQAKAAKKAAKSEGKQ